MRTGTRAVAVLALTIGCAAASWPMFLPTTAQRLANGNTVITDAGGTLGNQARVAEVDSLGRLVWSYLLSDIPWAHSGRRLDNGNTLITATNVRRVIEVRPDGSRAWQHSTGISYPNDAWRLANGNTLITDRDRDRAIEVTPAGAVVWSCTTLTRPHNGQRLANGNLLVCDAGFDGVREYDPSGAVVWQCSTGLNWPRCTHRLANGNTVIADSRNNRVLEVTPAGAVVWTRATTGMPYYVHRLANGNTIISAGTDVVEVNGAGGLVWRYPQTVAVLVETLSVFNPASGCYLPAHIHRPAWASAARKVPGVILVPPDTALGAIFDDNGLADRVADDGFAVLHYDADGRGGTRIFPENYGGHVNQDGMRECLLALAARPWVDTARIGALTFGYGITTAAGMVARHPDAPSARFLVDIEGPADRHHACADSGGDIPVPPGAEEFWREREAANFIRSADIAYLRVQTENDANGRLPDNNHAVAMVDSATHTMHGGSGRCRWTRVNDAAMNPPNRVYTVENPPEWIPEPQEVQNGFRWLGYLHELAGADPVGIGSGPAARAPVPALVPSASPVRRGAELRLRGPALGPVRVLDVAGRLVETLAPRPVPGGAEYRWRADVPAGCYWLAPGRAVPLKVAVTAR